MSPKFAALLLVVAGCSPSLPLDASVVVTCTTDADCPSGTVCIDGLRCVSRAVVDSVGPAMQSPDVDAVVRGSDQTLFVWQGVNGASSYALYVATDAALTQPVPGFPLQVDGLSAKVSLPAGTLYWAVTSDVTQLTAPLTGRRLGVIGDTIFVRCDAGKDCSTAADTELGTREVPYASIKRGLLGAQIVGATNVAVAHRQDGSAYAEAITVVDGINVSGAFDSDFAPSTTHTPIAVATPALAAESISAPTIISGFAFATTATNDLISTVVRINDTTSGLEIHDSEISAVDLVTAAVVIEDGVGDSGPLFENVALDASFYGKADIQYLEVMTITRAGLRISGGSITVNAHQEVQSLKGMSLTASSVALTNTHIVVHGGTDTIAVYFNAPPAVSIVGSQIEALGTAGGGAAMAVAGDNVILPVIIDRCDLNAGLSGYVADIFLNILNEVRVTSSLLRIDGGDTGAAIELGGAWPAVVTNNTIVVGAMTQQGDGLKIEDETAVIVNNVFIATNVSCGPLDPCVHGVYEASAGYGAAVFNNVFAGFTGHACAYSESDTCLDATINAPRMPQGNTIALGGNSLHTIAELGLSAEYLPPSTGILASAGHNPNADDCVATNPTSAPLRASTPSCGGPDSVDRNGVQRPNPPAIGAFEP